MDILLKDYKPISELVNQQHVIEKPMFPVIDAHVHFGRLMFGEDYAKLYDVDEAVAQFKSFGIEKVVNLDGDNGEYQKKMLALTEKHRDFIIHFGNVDASRLDDADFEQYVYQSLKQSKENGIKGLKLWKDISLMIWDKDGKRVPLDDKRLKPIWAYAAEFKLPITIHIADPTAFFKPINSVNERYEELGDHPSWSFYGDTFFSFEQLMDMQEHLIAENPNTTFIVAHVGSYAENLEQVSRWFDRYPNFYADIAERISELGRQPYSARKFITKYADRLLFGTDGSPLTMRHPTYYKCLETYDEYFDYAPELDIPPQGRWKIYGLGLDKDVLEKLYRLNAQRIIGI